MRNGKKGTKLTSIILGTLLLVTSFLMVGTINAYFTDGDTAVNMSSVGGNRIELVEVFEPPSRLEPGVTFTKDVKVRNVGSNDCFVRIKAVFTDSDMGKHCSLDWNELDYEYSEEDGYYYYKKVLKKNEETESLFTTVSLSASIPEAEIKDFDILIYTETYQSYGFEDYREAWTHYQRNKPRRDYT